MSATVNAQAIVGGGGGESEVVDPWDRLSWLCGLCRLTPLAGEILALVAGVRSEIRAGVDGWTVHAAALLLGVDEHVIAAELVASAPLVSWGLVRAVGPRVNVNPRIARFLLCGGRAAASA